MCWRHLHKRVMFVRERKCMIKVKWSCIWSSTVWRMKGSISNANCVARSFLKIPSFLFTLIPKCKIQTCFAQNYNKSYWNLTQTAKSFAKPTKNSKYQNVKKLNCSSKTNLNNSFSNNTCSKPKISQEHSKTRVQGTLSKHFKISLIVKDFIDEREKSKIYT